MMTACPVRMKDAHLLLVDDDPDLVDYVAGIYRRSGVFEVQTASCGRDALQQLAERDPFGDERYDLIVTDVRMPGPSGIQLVAMVRTAGYDVPFLVITAFPEPSVFQTLSQFEQVEVLGKPFEPVELIKASSRLIES